MEQGLQKPALGAKTVKVCSCDRVRGCQDAYWPKQSGKDGGGSSGSRVAGRLFWNRSELVTFITLAGGKE